MLYDYSKYENATPKQLIHALSLKEKKAEKLALEIMNNEKEIKFLKKQLKDYSNNKRRPELDEAIRDYENGNVVTCRSMEEFKAKMAED